MPKAKIAATAIFTSALSSIGLPPLEYVVQENWHHRFDATVHFQLPPYPGTNTPSVHAFTSHDHTTEEEAREAVSAKAVTHMEKQRNIEIEDHNYKRCKLFEKQVRYLKNTVSEKRATIRELGNTISNTVNNMEDAAIGLTDILNENLPPSPNRATENTLNHVLYQLDSLKEIVEHNALYAKDMLQNSDIYPFGTTNDSSADEAAYEDNIDIIDQYQTDPYNNNMNYDYSGHTTDD